MPNVELAGFISESWNSNKSLPTTLSSIVLLYGSQKVSKTQPKAGNVNEFDFCLNLFKNV